MTILMSLQTIGNFAIYFAAALIAVALFVVAYMAVTSHHEVDLIKKGNTAAAISFGGALIGFTLPLTSVIQHSVSLLDMAVWSVIALIVQIVVLKIVDVALREVSRHIEEGNVAAGVTLGAASIALGIVNAACMNY
jgi:putative membrane protein